MGSNYNVTYYGKNNRHFFTRAAEHMGVSNLPERRVKIVKPSAVSDYLFEYDCSIDFGIFDILTAYASKFNQSESLD